jgi:hypothetical protein
LRQGEQLSLRVLILLSLTDRKNDFAASSSKGPICRQTRKSLRHARAPRAAPTKFSTRTGTPKYSPCTRSTVEAAIGRILSKQA